MHAAVRRPSTQKTTLKQHLKETSGHRRHINVDTMLSRPKINLYATLVQRRVPAGIDLSIALQTSPEFYVKSRKSIFAKHFK